MNRKDQAMSLNVERGLVIFLLEGNVVTAAKYMAERNVPVEVARRVLLEPSKRRPSDWSFSGRI